MKTKNHINHLLLIFCLSSFGISAQFTYVDVTLGNTFMSIYKSANKSSKTTYNQTNVQINGLWRAKRNFGLGVTASIPVRNGGNYSISSIGNDRITKYSKETINSDFDYYFTESMKVAFTGRIYGGIKGNFYLDGRISFFSNTENLSYELNGVRYGEQNKFRQIAPGFSVGMNPHIGKSMYMNLNIGWDFYKFKDFGFKNGNYLSSDTYYLPSTYYSDPIAFKSPVSEKTRAFSLNFGLGYFF